MLLWRISQGINFKFVSTYQFALKKYNIYEVPNMHGNIWNILILYYYKINYFYISGKNIKTGW